MPSFSLPANHLLASEPVPALSSRVEVASECSPGERRNVAGGIVRRLLLALPALWRILGVTVGQARRPGKHRAPLNAPLALSFAIDSMPGFRSTI